MILNVRDGVKFLVRLECLTENGIFKNKNLQEIQMCVGRASQAKGAVRAKT